MFRPTLVIVAFREEASENVDSLVRCLFSLRQTAPEAQVLLIEDREPGPSSLAEVAAGELGCAYVAQDDGSGLVAAQAAGLQLACESGFDAVLIGADVELRPGWLDAMQRRRDTQGRPAAVVGGRLEYADGLVEHAGFFYSLLMSRWLSRFDGVPGEVPATQVAALCPVSARLAVIRHETLAAVGLPDVELEQPHLELDYCLRVFAAGLECVFEPAASGRSPRLPDKKLLLGISGRERLANLQLEQRHAPFDRFVPDVL